MRALRARVGDDLTLIGVGGITTPDDARERLDAGATLLQGYTAFIYEGPLVAPHDRDARLAEEPRSVHGPLHVTGEVLATKKAGAYRHLTITAPGIPQRFRAGNFVAVSVEDGRLARRALWIHRVKESGAFGPTLDVVVSPAGPGTTWLAERPVGSPPGGHRPAGPAVRAAPRAGRLRAGGRGARRGAAVPPGRPAARARLRASTSWSLRPTRPACSPRWRPGGPRAPSR